MSFLGAAAVKELGFGSLGHDVSISPRAVVYGASAIHLGHHVRIDDFVVLSVASHGARLEIGDFVHLGVGCALYAGGGITIGSFCNLSAYTTVYSVSDDTSGAAAAGAVLPDELRNVHREEVWIADHVMLGAHSVVLPGAHCEEGSVAGAHSLVKGRLVEWMIYGGVPAHPLKKRQHRAKELVARLSH